MDTQPLHYDDHLSIKDSSSYFFNSNKVIEEIDDDRNCDVLPQRSQDANKFYMMLEEDLKQKEDFMNSDEFYGFQQIVVISQLRKDYPNDDPFLTHVEILVKEIKKQVSTILKVPEEKDLLSILRVFLQDINIGFITSSGNIKGTAFIFILKSSIQPFFSMLQGKHKLIEQSAQPGLGLQLYFKDATTILQLSDNQPKSFKSAFIRNTKLSSQFIILYKLSEMAPDLQNIVMYKPIDDQIYVVKRSKLQSNISQLNFHDVFQHSHILSSDYYKFSEAQILAKLYHPNVLKLYDWWVETLQEGTFLYLQLELCQYAGFKYQPNDLLSYAHYYMNKMTNQQKMDKIIDITLQVLDGLEYIRKQGIRCNLKAEKIFVTMTVNMDLQIRLADFTPNVDVTQDIQSWRVVVEDIKSPGQVKPSRREKHNFDEIQAFGILLLHLVLTFPGDQIQRNRYTKTFTQVDNIDEILPLFDSWAEKLVRNRHLDFSFSAFKPIMALAKKLITKKLTDIKQIRQTIKCLKK